MNISSQRLGEDPYILASDLCMQIKCAPLIHKHKQVLIQTDK